MKTVLAPIDFSDISRRVIDEAIIIARAIGARLVLLNVVQLPSLIGTGVNESDLPAEFHLQVEKDAMVRLGELQRQLRDDGVTAHVIHQIGFPGERILEQVDRLGGRLPRDGIARSRRDLRSDRWEHHDPHFETRCVSGCDRAARNENTASFEYFRPRNGRLFIVIWNSILLHAWWAGVGRTRDLARLAIVAKIVTAGRWSA